jgi:hypothetical protein
MKNRRKLDQSVSQDSAASSNQSYDGALGVTYPLCPPRNELKLSSLDAFEVTTAGHREANTLSIEKACTPSKIQSKGCSI